MTFPLASASCLITDHRQFESVDYPPSIVPAPGASMIPNRVNTVSVDGLGDPDAGTTQVTFDVVVRDPNVEQRLVGQLLVDQNALNPSPSMFTPPPPNPSHELERPLTITLPLTVIGTAPNVCHKVEYWVSGSFDAARTPHTPGDVAAITWFIRTTSSSATGPVDMVMCP